MMILLYVKYIYIQTLTLVVSGLHLSVPPNMLIFEPFSIWPSPSWDEVGHWLISTFLKSMSIPLVPLKWKWNYISGRAWHAKYNPFKVNQIFLFLDDFSFKEILQNVITFLRVLATLFTKRQFLLTKHV